MEEWGVEERGEGMNRGRGLRREGRGEGRRYVLSGTAGDCACVVCCSVCDA